MAKINCNGNNHAIDCTCAFRGGHGNGSRSLTYLSSGRLYTDSSDGSYLDTRAKCPVCGDAVIFYKSPSDGRVFFDPPPGYPWPKHPCTDNSKERTSRTHSGSGVSSPRITSVGWDWFEFISAAPMASPKKKRLSRADMSMYIEGIDPPDSEAVDKHEVTTEPTKMVATRLRGIKIRRVSERIRRPIKVLKGGAQTSRIPLPDSKHEYIFSTNMVLKIPGVDEWFVKGASIFIGCAISIRQGHQGIWELSCLPLGSIEEEDNKSFQVNAELISLGVETRHRLL